MSNGWTLSMALISKQFGKLGESLSEALANFDPETATQVDRDALADKLRGFATKLAEARTKYNKEEREAKELRELIANDERAASVLITKFEAGETTEDVLTVFADELDANKAKLPLEEGEAKDAKDLLDAIEDLFKTVEKQLADYDANAKKVLNELARAKADKERAELRRENQETLKAMSSGLKQTSTALGALGRKAEALRIAADAENILAESGQKDIDKANAVADARKIAAGTVTPVLSAADRLRGLANK